MGPTVIRPVLDPLAVLLLDNQLYMSALGIQIICLPLFELSVVVWLSNDPIFERHPKTGLKVRYFGFFTLVFVPRFEWHLNTVCIIIYFKN